MHNLYSCLFHSVFSKPGVDFLLYSFGLFSNMCSFHGGFCDHLLRNDFVARMILSDYHPEKVTSYLQLVDIIQTHNKHFILQVWRQGRWTLKKEAEWTHNSISFLNQRKSLDLFKLA